MNKDRVLTALICLLIGATLAMVIVVLIALRQPAKAVKCNDGQSTQVENGVVYKTYIPANNYCKKGE